jgi:hypothetical protein
MVSLKFAVRSVWRRGLGLVLIVLPASLLFGMFTFLLATEATVKALLEPGIAAQSFRIGSVEGLASWEATSFSSAEANQIAKIPGVKVAPAGFQPCYMDPNDPTEFNCGATNATYVEIWDMDVHVEPAELARWDGIKNGAIVTAVAAAHHNWKVGDHFNLFYVSEKRKGIPLELEIAAISNKFIDPEIVYFHSQYYEQRYNETLRYWVIWVLVDKAERRDAVMQQVETALNEVHRPHQLWPMEMTQQAILSGSKVMREAFRVAGVFSLGLVVFVSVALLILSVEQRTTELAALLAIGYRRGVLARSVLAEGTLLVLPAAVLGAVLVWIPFHDNPIAFDVIFRVRILWQNVVQAIAGGALIGFLAAVIPAWRVYRLDILRGLR